MNGVKIMKYLLILVSYLLISTVAFAESPALPLVEKVPVEKPVGRLSDGRPYRVDEQGVRLSDYIAKIEVTNEELRKQVIGLEDELAETNRKLNARGNPNSLANNTACNYQSNANPYYTKVKELEAELASRSAQGNLSALGNQADITSLELSKLKSANELQKEQLQNLKKQLQTSLNDKEGLYQDLINKNSDSEENYSQIKNDNLELKQKISSLEKEVEANRSLKNLLEEKNQEISRLKSSANSNQQRAALVYTESPKAVLASEPSFNPTIVSYKSELRGQLQNIQGLILQRKNALDSLRNKKSGIIVSIQPLVTSSGMSLDRLRLAVDNLREEEEVADIKSGLSEISKLLNDDLAVINRLVH